MAPTAGLEPRTGWIRAELGSLQDLPYFSDTIAAVLLCNFCFHNFSGQREWHKYTHAAASIRISWDSRQTLTAINHFVNRQLHVWRM
jgi:hypothetical protein